MADTDLSNRPLRGVLVDLAVMTAIGLTLALIGPLGSYDRPFSWRLVYWLGVAYAGYALYRPISGLAARYARRFDFPEPVMWSFGCLVATVPMSAIVWLLEQLPGRVRWPSLEVALEVYGNVLVVGAGVTAIFYFLRPRASAREEASELQPCETTPEAPPVPIARFLERLPASLGQELIALEMEDHYVRAHTANGSDLILMRMRDAVAELDGIEGAQVHRSWWVARRAVIGITREGRNVRLVLERGLEAPVSRGNAPLLKAQGWW